MSIELSAASPPLPQPDGLTRFFWDGVGEGELRIQCCQDCGYYIHYPKPMCRRCQSTALEGKAVSGSATLYSWTIAVQAFHPFWIERLPFTLATVELVEQPGLMMASQIVDCPEDRLQAGMPLEVVFVELTPELTLPFFRPAAVDPEDAR
ncbi:MAG: DNA-binding protein [Deltaproteobacteria bacterium]|jgi:hypothetical protein|nr:DNA-binding protein [Deltaproteobacteria bacterium]